MVYGLTRADNPLLVAGVAAVTVVALTLVSSLRGMAGVMLLSLSVVVPVLVLPYSVLTYLRLDDAVFLLLFAWFLFDSSNRSPGPLRELWRTGLLVPFLGYHMLLILSLVFRVIGAEPSKMLGNMAWFTLRSIEAAFLFLVGFSLRKDEVLMLRYAKALVIFGTLLGIVGVLQFAGLLPIYNYLGFAQEYDVRPETGVTSLLGFNHGHLGGYLTIVTLLGVEVIDRTRRWRWLAATQMCLVGLVLSLSRASWVASAIAIVLYFTRTTDFRKIVAILLLGGGTLYLLRSVGSESVIEARLGMGEEEELTRPAIRSAAWRIENAVVAMRYIQEHPDSLFTGVGFMNWRYEVNKFAQGLSSGGHNNFLSVTLELGLVGLLFFVWFWAGLANRIGKVSRLPGSRAVSAALYGLLVSCLFQETFYPVQSFENFLNFVMFVGGLWLAGPRGEAQG